MFCFDVFLRLFVVVLSISESCSTSVVFVLCANIKSKVKKGHVYRSGNTTYIAVIKTALLFSITEEITIQKINVAQM